MVPALAAVPSCGHTGGLWAPSPVKVFCGLMSHSLFASVVPREAFQSRLPCLTLGLRASVNSAVAPVEPTVHEVPTSAPSVPTASMRTPFFASPTGSSPFQETYAALMTSHWLLPVEGRAR